MNIKKFTFENRFDRKYRCNSYRFRPKIKRFNRKQFRRQVKEYTKKEVELSYNHTE